MKLPGRGCASRTSTDGHLHFSAVTFRIFHTVEFSLYADRLTGIGYRSAGCRTRESLEQRAGTSERGLELVFSPGPNRQQRVLQHHEPQSARKTIPNRGRVLSDRSSDEGAVR